MNNKEDLKAQNESLCLECGREFCRSAGKIGMIRLIWPAEDPYVHNIKDCPAYQSLLITER